MNIFEIFGLADKEKIHSEFINWCINSEEITLKSKNKFLSHLFGKSYNFANIASITEYKNIDVLIECDNKHLFLIENKLKSSEHSNQLAKYTESIKNDEKYNDRHIESIFLTLIGEPPTHSDRKVKTYKDLLDALSHLDSTDDDARYILAQYTQCVKDICDNFDYFLFHHQLFPNVFLDGHKKKYEKKNSLTTMMPKQQFIMENNLEKLYQKGLLYKIAKEMGLVKFKIGEGKSKDALIQIDLIPFGNQNEWMMGIQIQGGTIKCNFSSINYQKSDISEVEKMELAINQNFLQALTQHNYKKNNPDSKCYVSYSKKILPNNTQYFDYSLEELVDIFTGAYNDIIEIYNQHNVTQLKILKKHLTPTTNAIKENDSIPFLDPKNVKHRLVALNINKTYKSNMGFYEATRGRWKMKLQNAKNTDYILSEYQGVIVAIFQADEREVRDTDKRKGFIGKQVIDNEVIDLYMNRRITKIRGASNPVRYFHPID